MGCGGMVKAGGVEGERVVDLSVAPPYQTPPPGYKVRLGVPLGVTIR